MNDTDEQMYEEEQLHAVSTPELEPIPGSWLEAWNEDEARDWDDDWSDLTAEELAEMDEDELVARGIDIPGGDK